MDILVVNCNTSPVITEAIRDAAQAVARPDTRGRDRRRVRRGRPDPDRRGADAIVLGCAGLAGLQQRVQARLDVLVVDGVTAAVTLCESLVQLGLRTSKVGPYATPDLNKLRPGWPACTRTPAVR